MTKSGPAQILFRPTDAGVELIIAQPADGFECAVVITRGNWGWIKESVEKLLPVSPVEKATL